MSEEESSQSTEAPIKSKKGKMFIAKNEEEGSQSN